ncbi:hypothetical protein ScPMuIL_014738 [Solemya velum]
MSGGASGETFRGIQRHRVLRRKGNGWRSSGALTPLGNDQSHSLSSLQASVPRHSWETGDARATHAVIAKESCCQQKQNSICGHVKMWGVENTGYKRHARVEALLHGTPGPGSWGGSQPGARLLEQV